MKKIKEIKANCLYVFQGRSCANSEFVRNLSAAKELIRSANERFTGYMKIRKYCITQDSWTFVVEVLDVESIKESYLAARSKSKKANPELILVEIWRIISECIRHWLSRFVRWTNYRDGREGSLRMKRYEKFFFETFEEASDYLKCMTKQQIKMSQKKKRFRPKRKKWKLHKIGVGHIYLCCNQEDKSELVRIFGEGCLFIFGKNCIVLRHLINRTLNHHFSKNYQNQHPKME